MTPNIIPNKEITADYIQEYGIYTSNIIVQEKTPGEGHKVFLERLERKEREEREPPIKIAENISYVHLYGARAVTNDILPICIIERGVLYVTSYVFYQIDESEDRRDLKLYIVI
jgi:hypothetical protein